MFKGVYKTHIKEINIKSWVYNYSDDLMKVKILQTKNILIDEKKNYNDLMICFTRYAHKKSTKLFSLYYQVLIIGKKIKKKKVKTT